MLTPTGVTINEYWNAIKAGNPTHVKMEFTEQNVTLTDEDIYISAGVRVDDILNGDTDLRFGRAVMKSINTSIIMTDRTKYINWTDEFTLSFGVEINGTTNWVAIGQFAGERPNNLSSAEIIDFTACDRMEKFDILIDDYINSLTYPITLQGFYEGLCTFVGIEYAAGDQLANAYSRQYTLGELDLKGYSCRDVLAWIAEACGCYAKITADGKCKLAWFSNNSTYTVTANEEFRVEHADLYSGMIWNEFDLLKWNEADLLTWDEVSGYYKNTYGIKAVKLKQLDVDIDIDYPQAEEKNIYIIENNPFMAITDPVSDKNSYVKPIYNRLDAFGGQLPIHTECIGNWLVEAGDIISIHVTDEIIESPIFVRTLLWKGSVNDSYETTGNKDRIISTAESRERTVTSKLIKLFAYDNFYQLRSGIEIKPEGIEIDANKYLKIKSGGEIDIESGGDINIKSGGNIDIAHGGTFSIQSGKFSIDSNGNATFGGELNAASGTFSGKISASGMELGPYTLKDANSKAGVYLREVDSGSAIGTFNNVLLLSGFTTPNNVNYHNIFKIGYHTGSRPGTYIPYIGNDDTNFDIADRTHYVHRAYIRNIVPGTGSKISMWLAGYDTTTGQDDKTIDFYISNGENYIVSPVDPNGGDPTGHVGTANDPMKDGYFDELYVGNNTINGLIYDSIGELYTGGDFLTAEAYHCTVGSMDNKIKGHIGRGLLVLCGRIMLTNITRSGSNPGVTVSLPSHYRIRTGMNQTVAAGIHWYSDGGRFSETTYVSYYAQESVVYIQVSETDANVTNGKTLMIYLPTVFIPVEYY